MRNFDQIQWRPRWHDFVSDLKLITKWVNPTVILTLVLSFFWMCFLGLALALGSQSFFYLIPLCILQTAVGFMFFTVFHDGSHGTAHRNRNLNEFLLVFPGIALLGNPWMFRRIHMRHHAYTNHPEKDPDHFTASSHHSMRWAKSFLIMFHYHWFGYTLDKSLKWKAHVLISAMLAPTVILVALATPFTWALIMVWVVPAWLALSFLGYANTAWPHHPAKETNRYRLGANQFVPWWLQFLMLNQNLHLLHHVKPNLPWWKYPEYFEAHREEFEAQGSPLRIYTKRTEPYSLVPSSVKLVYERLREHLSFLNPH